MNSNAKIVDINGQQIGKDFYIDMNVLVWCMIEYLCRLNLSFEMVTGRNPRHFNAGG